MLKYTMLVLFTLVALSVGCTPPGGTITASGNVVTQEEAISGFDKVEVSHAFKVDISQGETFSVVVRLDDNLLQYLEVVKQGNTLKIALKTDRITRDATLEAEVTMPGLMGLDLSGASHLRGDIEAGDAQLDVSDASQVILGGSAGNVTIDASGSSTVDLTDFPVADAKVDASSASKVTVNASGTLDVDASSASQVYYLGSPTLGTVDTSGESSVEQK